MIWRIYPRKQVSADEGIGMVVVIGTAFVIMLLTAVMVTVVTGSLASSSRHDTFESAMAVAEGGVDATLAQLQNNSSFTVCGCTAPTFASTSAEAAWAKTQILTLAQSQPSLITTTSQGQYLTIRPSNRQTVYSMGWVPSYSKPTEKRFLKAEYIFGPYKPGEAILTQGDLNMSGSVGVNNVTPGATAGVHTNGNATSSNASLSVSGALTSSGNYSVNGNATVGSGSGGGQPFESVPLMSARYVWNILSSSYGGPIVNGPGYTGTWYDLCPDGYVRARDTGTTPCSGTVLSTLGVTYRGWDFAPATGTTPPTWNMGEQSAPYPGIYYVYQGNANVGTSGTSNATWNATVLAESSSSDPCGRTDGDINWNLINVQNLLPGTVMLADDNLNIAANNNASDGLFGAGNQIHFSTSSTTLTGYVVANDQCPRANNPSSVQGVTINFDVTAESPVQSIIRTTLWLELTS